ncbi:hypothetical protein [Nonomuraea lactucae]|uniref:hypothetical protein n=1 Tax=Nonomuraea lactucae TaxID=2249762 RepID=UPI000DE41FEC|nr:hypothetical protein [Nonomuraea lactucae]
MIFLGLILVLLAGGAVVLVATEESARYILFGYTFQPDHVEMFAAGAVTAAVLMAGLLLIGAGSRRSARRRRQALSARAEATDKVAKLEDEKRDLQRRLEREQAAERQQAVERRQAAERERTAEHRRPPVPQQATGDRLVARGSDDTRS